MKQMLGESVYEGLKIFKITSNYSEKWRAYRSLYNPPVLNKLEEILKKISPELVHINNIHYHLSYHSIKIAKEYSKKVFLTFRDAMAFSYGKLKTKKYLEDFDAHLSYLDQVRQAKKRWNPLRNFVIKRYLKEADQLFAVSAALRTALEQNGIKNVGVIHTGIDLSQYPPAYNEHGKRIFFAGRLSGAKGVGVVEKVMQKVSRALPEAELMTAGAHGRWLNREDMNRAYATADVVLVPSICFDAFPRTVLEAMAMGKSVLATHYGGAREAIEDGVTGYVVNPFDIETMADKIIDLLKDKEKAERFGKASRERIKTHFNLNDRIDKLVKIYEGLS